MSKRELEARQQFITSVTRETAHPHPEALAGLLLRHGVTYAKLQEANCNGVGTWAGESVEHFQKRQDRFEKWIAKREQQIEKRVTSIAQQLGFGVIFGGDPRGWTIKLTVPSGKTTDWAHEGIGVPTS